jgi:riboflavin biosynthesis pyrimidine reductase
MYHDVDASDRQDGRMRELLPRSGLEVDVHEHYALEWADSGGLRANMVASADGAATAQGLSRGLQTPGDNRIFAALRDLADVVVAGAATVQAERYRAVAPVAARTGIRRQYGFGPDLPIALMSRTLQLDRSAPIFADLDHRPIVITTARADAAALAAVADVADVLVCGDGEIDFGEARRQLAALGLTRVLCEGGPRLLAAVLAAGELDELCLSVSPILTGPSGGRIVDGIASAHAAPTYLRLHSVLEEDGALFLRYKTKRRQ